LIASIVTHTALAVSLPIIDPDPPPYDSAPAVVAFDVREEPEVEPEPEPEVEPEPEPEVEPEPVAPPEPPEPEPELPEPEVEPEPPEPEAEPEPEPEPPAETEPEPDSDAASPTEDAEPGPEGKRATVVSTTGGLRVGMAAGDGSAGSGSGRRGTGSGGGAKRPPAPKVDLRQLVRRYMQRVAQVLRANHRYPLAARRAGQQGTVLLAITIDPRGGIEQVRVRRSSGHERLDEAAVASVRGLDSVPAPPRALRWKTRPVTLPIAYRLQ
jgi:protein TonB